MSGVRKLTNSQALAVFELWDADSDGSLTFEEFNQAYIDLGSPSMVLTLEEIFNSIDSDGDGISLEDHISALEAEPTTTVEPTTLGNVTTKQTTTPEGTTGETTTGPTIDTTIEITGSTPEEPDTKVPTTTFVPTTVPTTSVDPTTTDQTTTEEPTTIETTTEFISTTDIDDETTPRINPTTTEEPTTKVPTTTDDPTTTDQTTTEEPTTTVQTTTEEPTTTVQTTTDLTSTAQTSTAGTSTVQSTTTTGGGCNLDGFEADDNGNCFLVVTTKLNWSKANKACKALGSAILATIEDNTANTFIKGKLSANSWIGATDDSTEGTWEWTNGDTFSFNKWKDSSDISNADEDCAFIASSNGKWQDYDCSKKLQYVCMEK